MVSELLVLTRPDGGLPGAHEIHSRDAGDVGLHGLGGTAEATALSLHPAWLSPPLRLPAAEPVAQDCAQVPRSRRTMTSWPT